MKQKAKPKKGLLRRLAFVVLAVYAVFVLVDMQVSLAEKKEELVSLSQVAEHQRISNKDLKRQLVNISEDEEIERLAREQGYVAQNEKVFIDISGS